MCVRRALLANTLQSYLERSSIQLLAYSLVRSLIPVYLWPTSAYRERFLLNLRGRSIYTSAQFREAAIRESVALSGRPQREETRYVNVNVKRGRVGRRASGDSHDTYSHVYLSSSYSFVFLCFRPSFLVSTYALPLSERAIYMHGEAENANFDYLYPKIKKLNIRVFIIEVYFVPTKYSMTRFV